jgi:hypothetical protein
LAESIDQLIAEKVGSFRPDAAVRVSPLCPATPRLGATTACSLNGAGTGTLMAMQLPPAAAYRFQRRVEAKESPKELRS